MSGDNNFSHYSAFEITKQGLALRQRYIAGNKLGETLQIDFTRGAIGQGRPDSDTDTHFMTDLVDHAVDVPVKESYAKEANHIMVIVIDGLKLDEDVIMTEIGIFVRLIDAITGVEIMPELMYGYTYTNKYDYIPKGSSYNLHREIAFDTILSRDGKFEIVFDKDLVYITHNEFEDFYNEHIAQYPLIPSLTHSLNTYPMVLTIEGNYGYGLGAYGKTPYGGSESVSVRNNITYLDRNRIAIAVGKKYSAVKSVSKINDKEYILTFDSESGEGGRCTLSLLVVLLTNDSGNCSGVGAPGNVLQPVSGVTTLNGRSGDILLVDSDIPSTIARKSEIISAVETAVNTAIVTAIPPAAKAAVDSVIETVIQPAVETAVQSSLNDVDIDAGELN